jgi:hypothetical protein
MPSNHFVYFEFPHRMNKDGTIDSTCPRCFSSVGCSTWEAELDRMEAAHVCDPARLASFDHHRRMPIAAERFAELNVAAGRVGIPVRSDWNDRSDWAHRRGASSRRSA